MDVRLVTREGVEEHRVEDLEALLRGERGMVWVDIPSCDEPAAGVLAQVFGFHPLAVRDCVQRNRVPKVHAYSDHVFVVLHAPELGKSGHVHYVELDQFIGARYLVTVHGPVNPAVDPRVALRETGAVLRRLQSGRLSVSTPFELSYAIVSALARQQEAFVEMQTREVWQLEQRVTSGHLGDPEAFLEEMFQARHGLEQTGSVGAKTLTALSATPGDQTLNMLVSVPSLTVVVTCAAGVVTYTSESVSGDCQYCGAASITTWYWLSGE